MSISFTIRQKAGKVTECGCILQSFDLRKPVCEVQMIDLAFSALAYVKITYERDIRKHTMHSYSVLLTISESSYHVQHYQLLLYLIKYCL